MKVLISTSSFADHSFLPLEILSKKKFEIISNPFGRKMRSNEIISLAKDVDYIIAGTETYDPSLIKELTNLEQNIWMYLQRFIV